MEKNNIDVSTPSDSKLNNQKGFKAFCKKSYSVLKAFCKKSYSVLKAFYKKYYFIVICFLSSLPLIALGICALLFLYHPTSVWQNDNMFWIRPFGIVLFVLIVEFVVVGMPIIMISIKNKKEKKAKTIN